MSAAIIKCGVYLFPISIIGIILSIAINAVISLTILSPQDLLAIESVSSAVRQQNAFKCPQQFGYFRDQSDCGKYYICTYGMPLHRQCDDGLQFSIVLKTCDWPLNVLCIDKSEDFMNKFLNAGKQTVDKQRNYQNTGINFRTSGKNYYTIETEKKFANSGKYIPQKNSFTTAVSDAVDIPEIFANSIPNADRSRIREQNLETSATYTKVFNLPPIHLPVKYYFSESQNGERVIRTPSSEKEFKERIRPRNVYIDSTNNNAEVVYENYATPYDHSYGTRNNRLGLNVSDNHYIFIKPMNEDQEEGDHHSVLKSLTKIRNERLNPLLKKTSFNYYDDANAKIKTNYDEGLYKHETIGSANNSPQKLDINTSPAYNPRSQQLVFNVSLTSQSDSSPTRLFYKPINIQWQQFGQQQQQQYFNQPKAVANSFQPPIINKNIDISANPPQSSAVIVDQNVYKSEPQPQVESSSRFILPQMEKDRQAVVIDDNNNNRAISLEFPTDYHSRQIPQSVIQQLAKPGYVQIGSTISPQPKPVSNSNKNEVMVRFHPYNQGYVPVSTRAVNKPKIQESSLPDRPKSNFPVSTKPPIILTTKRPTVSAAVQYKPEILPKKPQALSTPKNQYVSTTSPRNTSKKQLIVENEEPVIVDNNKHNDDQNSYMDFLGVANLPQINEKPVKVMEIPLTVAKPPLYQPTTYLLKNSNRINRTNQRTATTTVKPKQQFPKRLFYPENAVKPKPAIFEIDSEDISPKLRNRPVVNEHRQTPNTRSRVTVAPIKSTTEQSTATEDNFFNTELFDEIEILRYPFASQKQFTPKPSVGEEKFEINSPKVSNRLNFGKPQQSFPLQVFRTPARRTTTSTTTTSSTTTTPFPISEDITTLSPVTFDDETSPHTEMVPTVRPFRGYVRERSRKPVIYADENDSLLARSIDSDIRNEGNKQETSGNYRNRNNADTNNFELQRTRANQDNTRYDDIVENNNNNNNNNRRVAYRRVVVTTRRATTASPLRNRNTESTARTTPEPPIVTTKAGLVFGLRSKPLTTPASSTRPKTTAKPLLKSSNDFGSDDRFRRSTTSSSTTVSPKNVLRFRPSSSPKPYYDFDYDYENSDNRAAAEANDDHNSRRQLYSGNERIITRLPRTTDRRPPLTGQLLNSRLNKRISSAQQLPKQPAVLALPTLRPKPTTAVATQTVATVLRCDPNQCVLPYCRCGDADIPGGLAAESIPQIVLLTFDDAVNDLNWRLYEKIFANRVNPNGCPISGTFYVSHEWTDYGKVQTLYSRGHEIASHGITHSHGLKYSPQQWIDEISGQREILHRFGGINYEDIRGMRAPFLQTGGNNMFEALYETNFTYDSSLPVPNNNPPFFPYTLDYAINHKCMIAPCPTNSFPGVWEVGMTMWQDLSGGRCSMGDACINPGDEAGVYEMLMKNFNRHYKSNRAPFNLYYHSTWFDTDHHRNGFFKFLDEILAKGDTYLVTNWQMIQWMREPTPLDRISQFKPWMCREARDSVSARAPACARPSYCNVRFKNGPRQLRTCQPCPATYPWLGNTAGS